MAMVRCSKRLSVIRSKKAQIQTRQVAMKAKVSLEKKQRNGRTRNMEVFPEMTRSAEAPKVRRKRRERTPVVRPKTEHGYSLRSRSAMEQDKDFVPPTLKSSLSSSHDSGIDSAASASDSEDSNTNGSDRSFPSSVPRLVTKTETTIAIDLVSTQSPEDSAPHQQFSCSFESVTSSFVSWSKEEDAAAPLPAEAEDDEAMHLDDPPSDNSSSSSSFELSLCAESLGDSTIVEPSSSETTSTEISQISPVNYCYTATASELEFVMEIFRGANNGAPARRIPAQLPPKTRSCPRYTLVLDLDETLVHCFTTEPPVKYDYSFNVEVPDASGNGEHTHLAVFARLRPFVREFLEKVSRKFEVMVFTASMKNYSSKMLDLLDPEGAYIKYRFYRDHCVPVGCGSFVKDLSIFNRDLSQTIIVDNQIASFAFHLDNGIPIRSWIGDDNDRDLLHLADFLDSLADCEQDIDVREWIRNSLKISHQLDAHYRMYYSHISSTPIPPTSLIAPTSQETSTTTTCVAASFSTQC